jgi:aryl-alcohol dehydrogenase-like predicted oxidoreductase
MTERNLQVTLAFGVGFFCNEPDKIPGQKEILQTALDGNIKMLDTSRIYVCRLSLLADHLIDVCEARW